MQLAPANFLVIRIGSQCKRSDREVRKVVPAGTGKYLREGSAHKEIEKEEEQEQGKHTSLAPKFMKSE
jgi:hypothetical protein